MTRVLNALAWLGTALVFAGAALRVLGMTNAVAIPPRYDQYAFYVIWVGLGLVILYTLSQWREIAGWFGHRNARYGTLAGVSVLVALGIFTAVNYLSTRQSKRWDLTANQQFSLSDQTTKLLQGLPSPVKFLVFEQATGFDRFKNRLASYEYASKQVNVEYIDADKYPLRAKEYEIQTYGTVVVEYMGRKERVSTDAEQDLTNALIKVINPTKRKVYFLAGHGERDTAGTEPTGYSSLAAAMRRDNYEFDKLVLAQAREIPADATMIVVAGPKTDLLEAEVPLLQAYLNKSGKMLVLLDPPDNPKQPVPIPRLTGLLHDWGIKATDSIVVDVSGMTNDPFTPAAAPPYPAHPITDRFNVVTAFPLVRAVVPEGEVQGRMATPFIKTQARSWAETDLSQLEQPKGDESKGDLMGPVTIGVAMAVPAKTDEKKEEPPAAGAPPPPPAPETRVVAIGDSDFPANAYGGVPGNVDLFMNTLGWLSQQENLISIRPREAADRRLSMTATNFTEMFLLSIFLVPAAVLGAGVYTWWRRR